MCPLGVDPRVFSICERGLCSYVIWNEPNDGVLDITLFTLVIETKAVFSVDSIAMLWKRFPHYWPLLRDL